MAPKKAKKKILVYKLTYSGGKTNTVHTRGLPAGTKLVDDTPQNRKKYKLVSPDD